MLVQKLSVSRVASAHAPEAARRRLESCAVFLVNTMYRLRCKEITSSLLATREIESRAFGGSGILVSARLGTAKVFWSVQRWAADPSQIQLLWFVYQ